LAKFIIKKKATVSKFKKNTFKNIVTVYKFSLDFFEGPVPFEQIKKFELIKFSFFTPDVYIDFLEGFLFWRVVSLTSGNGLSFLPCQPSCFLFQ
jgi:hypothetical protein